MICKIALALLSIAVPTASVPATADEQCVFVVSLDRGGESHELMAIRVTQSADGYRVETDPGGWRYSTDPADRGPLDCDRWTVAVQP